MQIKSIPPGLQFSKVRDVTLATEYAVIKRTVLRNRNEFEGVSFLLCVGTDHFGYLRMFETGSMNGCAAPISGFFETEISTIVVEISLTDDDITNLKSSGECGQRRSDDMAKIRKNCRTLEQALTAVKGVRSVIHMTLDVGKHKLQKYSFINGSWRHENVLQTLDDMVLRVLHSEVKPKPFALSRLNVIECDMAPWEIGNCLPNFDCRLKWMSDRERNKLYHRVGRIRCARNLSMKSSFLSEWNPVSLEDSFKSVILECESTACVELPRRVQPFKKRKSNHGYSPPSIKMSMSNDSDVLDKQLSSSKSSLLGLFRSAIIAKGKIWLVTDDISKCVIVWNTVDAVSGYLNAQEFCSTTFYKLIDSQECSDCAIYRISSTIPGDGPASCPHICLRDDVLKAIGETYTGNEFVDFIRRNLKSTRPVNVIRVTENTAKLLVIADDDVCTKRNIRCREGVVSIMKSKRRNDSSIQCHNIACRRKKMISRITHPGDFCPHFQKLWQYYDQYPCLSNFFRSTDQEGPMNQQSTESEGSSELTSSDSNESGEGEHVRSSSHVKYDVEKRRFLPILDPKTPIPMEPSADSRRWAEYRRLGNDLQRDSNGNLFYNSDGYLIGLRLCTPSNMDEIIGNVCTRCGIGNMAKQNMTDFKLHTCHGTVIRERFYVVCSGEIIFA